jgi:ABC-type cobalamin/Fe3+-siderophores transport system ATPase subunit
VIGSSVAPLVAATDLTFGYGARPILRGVSVAVGAGELVALCGPNGAGKTTLLRLLLGLLAPASGEVRLGGAPLTSLTRREIARRAALLVQDPPADLPLTVREAVALGRLPHLARFQPLSAADEAAIDRALAATDVAGLAPRPVAELSGGERHRVHLARALAQEAPCLLLDEPVGGLDVAHQLVAVDLLRAMADAGRGILVALHDLSLAARGCDRIVLLADGGVAGEGPPAEVLIPEALARVFSVRAEVVPDAAGRPRVFPIEALPTGGRR